MKSKMVDRQGWGGGKGYADQKVGVYVTVTRGSLRSILRISVKLEQDG